eukprot:TRINITY_DN8220_c0_g1_i1.p1 TRINITY_DN8220_c0_g1~~TRINITY_DN8220_c0_g1_i1.p1  ORF type:complete len:278 (-),score=70.99 TRINITY_DN8220_c0_g1_i1:67-900(-)
MTITICNLGDSRALLIPSDKPFASLTIDHKPNHPDEKKRIEAAGGFVSDVGGVARVNGCLAVSRAFGDKPFKLHPSLVSVTPEITETKAVLGDYLLLACDGLFEPGACTSEWVANFVRTQLERSDNPEVLVKELISEALRAGSCDNITVMLIKFKKPTDANFENSQINRTPRNRTEEDTASNSDSDDEKEAEGVKGQVTEKEKEEKDKGNELEKEEGTNQENAKEDEGAALKRKRDDVHNGNSNIPEVELASPTKRKRSSLPPQFSVSEAKTQNNSN